MNANGETHILPPRYLEVLALTADGLTTKQAAKTLLLGVETVKTYKRSLILEFNAKNMAQVISIAYKKGILPIDE